MTKQIDPNAKGPGESGRMDKILDAGFKQPAGESVLIQNRSLQAGTPAFAAAVDDVVARLSKVAVVRNVQAPKIAGDRHAVLIDFDISGDKDTAADRLDPVLTSVGDAGRPIPSFFVGEFGGASAAKGVDTRVRRRPEERRCVLNPADADHPRRGVRRTGRRGDPAAARTHGDLRDLRARGVAESRDSAGTGSVRGRAADRARRRRGLLALLSAARA